jgi:hypothetical protein
VAQTSDPAPLAYAVVRNNPAPRAWRAATVLGLVYLLLLGIVLALQVRPMLHFMSFVADSPRREPFMIAFLMMQTLPVGIVCTNALAVAGYAVAARGHSPRALFVTYALAQSALIALVAGAAALLVWHGPINFTTQRGAVSGVGVPARSLVLIPVVSAVLSLPLVALLVPKVRRACFARGPSATA